jgi:zinc transporter, ZIP family
MIEAFLWGGLAASALLAGALLAYITTPSTKVIAVVMALGAGLLIGSVAFELIDEALATTDVALVGLFTLIGAATFTVGNRYLDAHGAGDRKDAAGALLAMVTDTMLPESYEEERISTGSLVAIGFAISLMLSAI